MRADFETSIIQMVWGFFTITAAWNHQVWYTIAGVLIMIFICRYEQMMFDMRNEDV